MINITNHTKISPPRIPGILPRPRLLDLLNKNRDKRLILILGQAAQGKSTLAASYAATQDSPVAWLNLDQGDSDPINLFYWLINAFNYIFPNGDFSFLRSYPSSSRGPREPILLYQEWVQVMFEQINEPVRLTLDGLDRLSTNAPSLLFIQTLVHEAPPHVNIILLSREEPPFGLPELKIKQQAYFLTNDDLAFSLEETRMFFQKSRKINLNPTQISRIHTSTEGWVGGLLLFSEALQRLPEGVRDQYISEKIPDNFRKEAFRFFDEVILSSQPLEVQEFLIKSSVLDRMETQFLRDLLETKAMEEVFHEAARKHLFVQSNYDEGKGWVFRYHQLFRDFLQMKFKTGFSTEKQKALYLKTGFLLQKRNRQEEAIRFFLKAEDYKSAVFVIEKIGYDLFMANRLSDLQEWLQALPEEIIQGNPWLLYYLSLTRRFTAPAKNMVSFYQTFSAFEKAGDIRGCLVSLTELINATILSGHDLVPLIELANKGETLLKTIDRDLYPREKANLWALTGLGFICFNPQKAYQAAQNAYLMARETKEPLLQINALMRIFQILQVQHEVFRIEEISKEIENLLKKFPYPQIEISYRVLLGIDSFTKGDLEKSEAEFEYAKKECQRLGLSYLYAINLREYMILKMNLGLYQEAEELGQHLLQISTTLRQPRQTGIILYNLGRNRYFEGDYKKAEEYLERSYEILSAEGSSFPWYLYGIRVLRGLMASYKHPNESTFKDLQNALIYYSSISSGFALEAHFALALCYWQKKNEKRTAFHLRSGFEIAKEKGHTYFPYTSPRDKARIYALAVEIGDGEQGDQILKILSNRRFPQAEAELERLLDHPDPTIRAKAAKIELALHRSTLSRLRIETLGGFKVFLSGSPIKEEEWHGNQTQNMLKAIVSQGEKGIRKEVIMEGLWPEGQTDRVEKNFKITLHRLRQILEPDVDQRYGYSYVQRKENRLFLDKEICEVDVEKFLTLKKEGEKKEDSVKIEEALSLYKEAADLYKGDFLPEDAYAEWAETKREDLRKKYFELLIRMARIYENRGAARKAITFYEKVIEVDPFSEKAHRHLMVLYAGLGKPDKALYIYQSYQNALRQELDAEPDESIKSLYNKIQNS